MATAREMVELIVQWLDQAPTDRRQCAREMEAMLRQAMPGERVHIPHPDTSKKEAIREAARHLPTGVVAARFGVSRQWVHRVAKK